MDANPAGDHTKVKKEKKEKKEKKDKKDKKEKKEKKKEKKEKKEKAAAAAVKSEVKQEWGSGDWNTPKSGSNGWAQTTTKAWGEKKESNDWGNNNTKKESNDWGDNSTKKESNGWGNTAKSSNDWGNTNKKRDWEGDGKEEWGSSSAAKKPVKQEWGASTSSSAKQEAKQEWGSSSGWSKGGAWDEPQATRVKEEPSSSYGTPTRVKTEPSSWGTPSRGSRGKEENQLVAMTPNRKRPGATPTRPKKMKAATEESIEAKNKWWEGLGDKSEIKWDFLEHKAYFFPPLYIKHNVPIILEDGEKLILSESSEELATYWASCIGSDYEFKDLFRKNFWDSWTPTMTDEERDKIESLDNCDFSLIRARIEHDREQKKARSKEEKDAEAAEKKKFTHALVDGFREKVGSYTVEPPQLFRGRGEHPMQGKLKDRVPPEECVLNCDLGAPIPRIPQGQYPGHCWKNIVHDDSVTWLGYYFQASRNEFKYFYLGASSGIKGESDLYKYEKARRLHSIIKNIRREYSRTLRASKDQRRLQLATATFFIDRLALRVGGEKDTDMEADTVGCTSLRVEHLRFNNPEEDGDYKVTLDFLGKDSVRFLNEISVPSVVFNALVSFTEGKDPTSQVFGLIDPDDINSYFKEFMDDLSAKVFRTYNASATLDVQLALFDMEKLPNMNTRDILSFYNDANRKVAILCNHQKGVAKSHTETIQKMMTKVENINLELKANREQLQYLKRGEQRGIKEGELFTRLGTTEVQVKKRIVELKNKLQKEADAMTQRDMNKNVSLTTSRVNYMDPRITVAFCKKVNLEVKHLFPATMMSKFPWALAVDKDFSFRTLNTDELKDKGPPPCDIQEDDYDGNKSEDE